MGPGFGSNPSAPGFGAPGSFGPHSGYGPPPAKSGRGMVGLLIAVVLGGLVLVGGGIAVAVVVLSDEPAPRPAPVTAANVRIETNVATGELFVDGTSRGTVVPNQQFRIERGQHTIEIRENGLTVASGVIDVVAGQDQTVTLNRAAPIENANVMQPGRVQTFTGQLRRGDTVRPTNQYADSHYFDWVAGQTVRVELDSDDVDTYLIVTAPSGIAQHNDDRPDGTLNSALTIQVNETGRWHVQASTYGPYSTGDYTLRVHGP